MRLTVTSANIAFWVVWAVLFVYCRLAFYDDPTSLFYDRTRAYQQRYSLHRTQQADELLDRIDQIASGAEPGLTLPGLSAGSDADQQPDDRLLCIGIPSINRTTQSFLAHTLASLSDTLTPDERASIHLVVLLADQAPTQHTAYHQPWLEYLADEVLVYGNATSDRDHFANASSVYHAIDYNVRPEGPPRGASRVENMRLDHSVLVETCRAARSPYFALVEDDVIASADWFTHLKRGLAAVQAATAEREKSWSYLRMFYSETYMGWNTEEWLYYSESVVLIYAVALIGFLVFRQWSNRRGRRLRTGPDSDKDAPMYEPLRIGSGDDDDLDRDLDHRNVNYNDNNNSTALQNLNFSGTASNTNTNTSPALLHTSSPSRPSSPRAWRPSTVLTAMALGLWLPALIVLYFMAGRVSVSRINPFTSRSVVREMPRYGCCAQGLVFPQPRLDGLQKLLREPPYDFPGDMKIEGWTERQGLSKWALEPSVLQHVGLKESSEGPRLAEVWNFSFERHRDD